jgi:hypothetical protein
MGELYVFDHDGTRLHPPLSEKKGRQADGGSSSDLTGMPTSDSGTSGFFDDVTDSGDDSQSSRETAGTRDQSPEIPDGPSLPDNLSLQFGVNDNGAILECVVNGVETTTARKRTVFRYETDSTSGVFPEFIDAIEAELVEQRGWMIGTIENPRNPGYVFQRLRDAASGTDPTPQQLPHDPDLIQGLLEERTTLTFRVRDFSVAGDLILRYGNIGCNISIAENRALRAQPTGLVVVQDDSIDRAVVADEDSSERIAEAKRAQCHDALARGVNGLADLELDSEEAATLLENRIQERYDDVGVMGPERKREVSNLAKQVKSLKQKNEQLQERTRKLREKNEKLQARDSPTEPGTAAGNGSPDSGTETTDGKGTSSATSTAGGSTGTAGTPDVAQTADPGSTRWRRIGGVLANARAIFLLWGVWL